MILPEVTRLGIHYMAGGGGGVDSQEDGVGGRKGVERHYGTEGRAEERIGATDIMHNFRHVGIANGSEYDGLT